VDLITIMMVHQTAEKLVLIDVLDSSPKKYSASQEWVQGSGVSEDITKLNLKPLIDRAVIAMKLGWKKYLDNLPLGWWVSGLNLRTMQLETFGQFKPNEPVKLSAKDKDAAKYLTSKGQYDAIALQHPGLCSASTLWRDYGLKEGRQRTCQQSGAFSSSRATDYHSL
jgi:hypothetical protein